MKRIFVSILMFGWWGLAISSSAWSGQITVPTGLVSETTAKATTEGITEDGQIETVKARIAELQDRIQTARRADIGKEAGRWGIEVAEYQRLIDQMSAEQSAYEQLLKIIDATKISADNEVFLRQSQASPDKNLLTEEPPYSLTFFDNLLDDLQSVEQRRIISEMALRQSQETITITTNRLGELERKKRQLAERQDSKNDSDSIGSVQWQLRKLTGDVDLSKAQLALEKAKSAKLELEDRLAQTERALIEKKVQWVRQHLSSHDNALDTKLALLEKRKVELNGSLKKLTVDLGNAETLWLKAQKRNGGLQNADAALEAEKNLQAAEEWRNTIQTLIEQTYAMLGLIDLQGEYWRRRQSLVSSSGKLEELTQWETGITGDLDQIRTTLDLQRKRQINLQSRLAGLENEFDNDLLSKAIQSKMKNQLAAMRQLADAQLGFITELTETQKLGRRLLDEIAAASHRISLWKHLAQYSRYIEGIWDFEVIQIDNNSVTVSKIVFSLLILVIGITLVRYIIRTFTQRLFRYTNLRDTNAAAISKVLLFSGYLLVFLFALRMVNIPLAAFAFLGGAVAIGVGFGAQNLINNFISGFIIMGERPISIGDLIEVDGVLGQVEEVGARCTRVRTGENIHILVPNSSFLEKNITNWTLSDQNIRTHINVGVIYGSPVRQVEVLLLQAARENEKVLHTPEPFVLFRDFGDNALIFELYFWISISKVIERRIIESSIRFRIEELFGDAGIVIAFPQHDVHLDTSKPLELHLVDAEQLKNGNP